MKTYERLRLCSWGERGSAGVSLRTALHSAEAHVLDLEEVVDAVLRALAPEARLLHAAEGRDLVRDDAHVHAHDARLERLGGAEDAAHVARIEVRAQAELAVVRERDRLRIVLEAEERRHRPEGFLARDLHGGVHAGEDGGLVE